MQQQTGIVAAENEERAWVAAVRAGDADAAGRLYDRYFDQIYRYIALQVSDPGMAEALTERVFLQMVQAAGTYATRRETVATWLYRIAHDLLALASPAPRLEGALAEVSGATVGSRVRDRDRESRRRLWRGIGQLPAPQAQVVLLKCAAGLTNAEVSAVLNRPTTGIPALQYRALQRLGNMIERTGTAR